MSELSSCHFPHYVLHVLKKIQDHGFEAYIVGGAVRDIILGRKVTDFDLCSNALPQQIQQIFKKIIPTGIKYGTVTVRAYRHSVEITTFRVDQDYDGRWPAKVDFIRDINQDLSRRDFTINAMAYDPFADKLVDIYRGVNDCNNKLIKTVGDPNLRFAEDSLRMLRAIRFAVVLGFSIDPQTFKAIDPSIFLQANISRERILAELQKIVLADIKLGFLLLYKSGLLKILSLSKRENKQIRKWQGKKTSAALIRQEIGTLNITGDDLLNLGIPFGKKIGTILKDLLNQVKTHKVTNNKKELIKYLKKEKIIK